MDNSHGRLNPSLCSTSPAIRGAGAARATTSLRLFARTCTVGAGDYGFRSIIAPSFADIFYNNCFKSLLPIVLDAAIVDRLFKESAATKGIASRSTCPISRW